MGEKQVYGTRATLSHVHVARASHFFDTRRADQGGAAADGAAGGGQEGDLVAREEDKLYGEWQTSVWTPPPVGLDGKVPKNEYGTWGLPNARHLPAGAVHLNMPGVAKAAKKLGIDFAKAVTSFEFKNGRNLPVEDGIITAAGNVRPHLGYKCASKKSAHLSLKGSDDRFHCADCLPNMRRSSPLKHSARPICSMLCVDQQRERERERIRNRWLFFVAQREMDGRPLKAVADP